MTRKKLLSVLDIAEELNTGKATVKFLLKRFKKWALPNFIDGQPFYSSETVKTLFFVQEKLEMGLLPSDIEKELEGSGHSDPDDLLTALANPPVGEDIRMSKDGLTLLKSLFHGIEDQQKKIAAAHEKRAEVEERKAVAIEKRAIAEEKKAEAMNNIANALQEMNALRAGEPDAQQIAHQTATVIVADETDSEDTPFEPDDPLGSIQKSDDSDETDLVSSMVDDDKLLEDSPDIDEISTAFDQELDDTLNDSLSDLSGSEADLELDNLSSLIEEDTEIEPSLDSIDQIDNLSLLLNETQKPDDIPDATPDATIDDLTQLIDKDLLDRGPIDENTGICSESEPLDDLSSLLDTASKTIDTKKDHPSSDPSMTLDDLSILIDPSSSLPEADPPIVLDDLSVLIDQASPLPEAETSVELDDLSKLVDDSKEPEQPPQDIDDLSLLIDQGIVSEKQSNDSLEMDNLSKLIDDPKTMDESSSDPAASEGTPAIIIDISPEEDLGKYKAAIMKVIIGLKADGLSVEELTNRLNKNKIKTISGKPEWNQKAISQIYKFIESAK